MITSLSQRSLEVRRGGTILDSGSRRDTFSVLTAGLAARTRIRENGARQITAILVPGDVCDFSVLFSEPSLHRVEALTDCEIASDRIEAVQALMILDPFLTWTTCRSAAAELGRREAWVLNARQRTPTRRVAHVLCEIFDRTRGTTFADRDVCSLPLGLDDLASATDSAEEDVEIAMRLLRQDGVIEVDAQILAVRDWPELCDIGQYEPLRASQLQAFPVNKQQRSRQV
ncbi:Crp/Fnr family transcriptional regulator [Mangrovibrevibacter kandeliae]|uniref:Crp/Fnr family transcriptional regulator n=1 Tax=Mangrovibrevibacter kandeliae TaxID=2968473 RepID=UPI002118C140|nr:Crp/Fnr family transcriptional regulator [Aurantimonas sp. CSK15Z-1]MCQ8781143.1 Crp/Fnr family transcriptional regulator [Aurantimonas sp. CSK15Z-1]